MAGHDLRHHFLLHETPRPIAGRALVVSQEFFDGVIIQRGHAMRGFSTVLYLLWFFCAIILSHGTTSRVSRQSDSRRQRIQDSSLKLRFVGCSSLRNILVTLRGRAS